MKLSLAKNFSEVLMRYSLVLILLWYGIFKFTPTEAKAIEDLILNSPFFSWMYDLFSLQTSSNIIGTFEILTALLLIAGQWNKLLLRLGSIAASVTFIGTLSFLFTTPDMFKMVDWMPITNGFILKDLSLLGISLHLAFSTYNN